jgi:hypothetical protein
MLGYNSYAEKIANRGTRLRALNLLNISICQYLPRWLYGTFCHRVPRAMCTQLLPNGCEISAPSVCSGGFEALAFAPCRA